MFSNVSVALCNFPIMSTKLFLNAAEILTYTVDVKAENRARPVQKAKVSSVVLLSLINLKVLLVLQKKSLVGKNDMVSL